MSRYNDLTILRYTAQHENHQDTRVKPSHADALWPGLATHDVLVAAFATGVWRDRMLDIRFRSCLRYLFL
jgi:hypothetical protein